MRGRGYVEVVEAPDAGAPPKGPSCSVNAAPRKKRGPVPATKRTPEARERILFVLSCGGSWAMAAAAGNMTDETLHAWRVSDPEFSAECARARDTGAVALVEKIKAESIEDWRAAAWMLERIAPAQYGRRVLVAGDAGAPLRIAGDLKIAESVRSSVSARSKVNEALAAVFGRKRK